jgi:predicted deacylase
MAFGLPYVLTVDKPVQPSKGSSSYAAAAGKGVPAILAEAGGVGQMQEDAVALLVHGVMNVMRHLGMLAGPKSQIPSPKSQGNSKSQTKKTAHRAVKTAATETAPAVLRHSDADVAAASTVLTKFEWAYAKFTGVWYPKVAAGDVVKEAEELGTVGDLFGDALEKIISPVNGVILFLTINPSVLEGGLLMGIGVE